MKLLKNYTMGSEYYITWPWKEGLAILAQPLCVSHSFNPPGFFTCAVEVGQSQAGPRFCRCSPSIISDRATTLHPVTSSNVEPKSSSCCIVYTCSGSMQWNFETQVENLPFHHSKNNWYFLVVNRENKMGFGLTRQKEGPISSQLFIQ